MLPIVAFAAELSVIDVGEAFDKDHVELRGVGAGKFDPATWGKGPPNLVPDIRSPLIAPRDDTGKFRNIYAPSIIRHREGWRIFFGGWDGSTTGNDRIYSLDTDADFAAFTNRRTVIDHGPFRHVCNVSVARTPDGYAMACTAYPAARDLNKPVIFASPDAERWNATAAGHDHLVTVTGYEKFDDADINGMNVLLHDGGALRLYFNNFRDPGKTFRATGVGERRFSFDGVVLEPSGFVNDIKRVAVDGVNHYLAAFHHNGQQLFYSLGRDPEKLPPQQTLLTHHGDADRFIVSVGFIATDDRVPGVFYGAGASPHLNENRIFARWFQKKVGVEGIDAEPLAFGPDRQLVPLPAERRVTLKVLADHGVTVIATSPPVVLSPGRAYRLDWPQTPPTPNAPARAATAR